MRDVIIARMLNAISTDIGRFNDLLELLESGDSELGSEMSDFAVYAAMIEADYPFAVKNMRDVILKEIEDIVSTKRSDFPYFGFDGKVCHDTARYNSYVVSNEPILFTYLNILVKSGEPLNRNDEVYDSVMEFIGG